MVEREEILQANLQEYLQFGELAFKQQKFNSAATLFFKAICAAVDIYILKHSGFVPSSHNDRFRVVQERYPNLYELLDRDFPFYQNSYTQKLDQESAGVLRDDAYLLAKDLAHTEK